MSSNSDRFKTENGFHRPPRVQAHTQRVLSASRVENLHYSLFKASVEWCFIQDPVRISINSWLRGLIDGRCIIIIGWDFQKSPGMAGTKLPLTFPRELLSSTVQSHGTGEGHAGSVCAAAAHGMACPPKTSSPPSSLPTSASVLEVGQGERRGYPKPPLLDALETQVLSSVPRVLLGAPSSQSCRTGEGGHRLFPCQQGSTRCCHGRDVLEVFMAACHHSPRIQFICGQEKPSPFRLQLHLSLCILRSARTQRLEDSLPPFPATSL